MALTGKTAERGGWEYNVGQLAPLTSKAAQKCGWRHQAEQLVSTHTSLGLAAMTLIAPTQSESAPKQVTRQRRTAKLEAGNTLALTKLAGPRPKSATENLVTRTCDVQTETPASQTVLQSRSDSVISETSRLSRHIADSGLRAVDRRIVKPEDELGFAREEIVHLKNENRSLERSLDLLVGENSRLDCCLSEKDTAIQAILTADNETRSQLEQMKTALLATEAERDKRIVADNDTNESRQIEINMLYTRLEAMSARAVAAEKLLADARQSWLVHIEENSVAQRKIADATEACDGAEKEIERLRDSLVSKDFQLQELERSRSTLIASTDMLLAAFKKRDMALLRSEERIKMLTERVAQLEAEMKLASQREIEQLNSQLRRAWAERAITKDVGKAASTNFDGSQGEFDNYFADEGKDCGSKTRSAQLLLADTITFWNAA